MFNILVDFELTKKIKIEKIGLIFRKLTKKEKNMILKQIDNIYTKNKRLINQCIKKYQSGDELKLSIELLKYDDSIRKIVMFCFLGIKSGFSLNTPSKIQKLLNQVIIIEYDKNIIFEYIEEKNIVKFISNILSLYDIYSKNIYFNTKVRLDYSFILTDNILDPKEKDYDINLITNLLATYKGNNKMKKMTELSEEYLLQLKSFFSKLKKDEIRRFLNVIDLLYSNHLMLQNNIVNNISIAEAILINENEDIKSNYILKAGIILKYYRKKNNNAMNKFIKDFLNYCYDIRSSIVHGNEEKILSIFNSITQKNKNIRDLANLESDNYNSKKIKALSLANTMSFLVVRAIIKYWIDNPFTIIYMKD